MAEDNEEKKDGAVPVELGTGGTTGTGGEQGQDGEKKQGATGYLKYKLLPISELSALDIWQEDTISGLCSGFEASSANDLLIEASLLSSSVKSSRSISLKDTLNRIVSCLSALCAAITANDEDIKYLCGEISSNDKDISDLTGSIDSLCGQLEVSSLSSKLDNYFLPLSSNDNKTVCTPTKFTNNLTCVATSALWA